MEGWRDGGLEEWKLGYENSGYYDFDEVIYMS